MTNRIEALEAECLVTMTAPRRLKDRRLEVIATMPGGEQFIQPMWITRKAERAAFINELCEKYPGFATERTSIRKQLDELAKRHRLDIVVHPPHGKVNGRASTSIDFYLPGMGDKPAVTDSGNMLDSKFRIKVGEKIADKELGRNGGQRARRKVMEEVEDFLMREVQRLRDTPEPSVARPEEEAARLRYVEIPGVGLFFRRPLMGGGEKLEPLTNFTARITANIARSDGGGGEPVREVEIETELKGVKRRIVISTSDFRAMNWPLDRLGAEYIIEQGPSSADHARAAIQKLSPDPLVKTIRTYTGWVIHPKPKEAQ